MEQPTYVLLITCADQIGLVHHITGMLYAHGLNIIGNQEFVEPEQDRFFMRTSFSGTVDTAALLLDMRRVLPPDAYVQLAQKRRKRAVVLVTREAHCLGELLLRHRFDELNADILAVIGNHDTLEQFTRQFGINFHFVSAFPHRIVNIHHSFLPAFVGASPYRQAYERGVKIIGATAHFVNNDLDEEPIIVQNVIPVDHTFSVHDMVQSGKDVEKIVLARALRLVFDDQLFVHDNKTIIFD